ncbi:MAG: exodeoxyribonuclease III [Nitriliruptoraceae bacterium]
MRLVTWNVNSIRARLPRVLELLDAHAPEVVCVQETKATNATFPHDALAAVGYRAVERSEGRWNGVALLVRDGLSVGDVRTVLPGEPAPDEARWIEALVDGVRIASVYVPNGRDRDHPMFAVKLRFLAAMRDRLIGLVGEGPAVVAGDLNVAREDRDVWDVAQLGISTHITPEERAGIDALLDVGFVDVFRAVEPDGPGFTWWDYRMQSYRRGWGMRIDVVLASRDLATARCAVDTRFREPNVAGDKPSDHAPVVVDLEP